MSVAVLFPDVEALLVNALADALPAGTVVSIEKPEVVVDYYGVPLPIVLVRLEGGPQIGRAMRADTVTARCWAATDEAVADLSALAQQAIYALQDLDGSGVSAVDVLSGSSAVLDDSLIPCRIFTAQVYVRGS